MKVEKHIVITLETQQEINALLAKLQGRCLRPEVDKNVFLDELNIALISIDPRD